MSRRKIIFGSLIGMVLALAFFLSNRMCELVRTAVKNGGDLFAEYSSFFSHIAKRPLYISLDIIDLGVGFIVALLIFLLAISRKRVFRPGEEYGSARFGTSNDIKPFVDPVSDRNIILTQTECLSMQGRMKIVNGIDYNRNKNVVVIGGTGTGKTRYFVKPNLLQMYGSYIVTDPKGTLLTECGQAFEVNHYQIRVLNLNGAQGIKQSLHYNPFAYIRSEADILKLVDVLMSNTNGNAQQSTADPFWQASEKLLYTALIGYIWDCGDPEEQNIGTLLDLLGACDVREDDENYKNPVDLLFDNLEKDFPNHFALRQYRKYRQAAGKTAKSILISCGARLAAFDISEVRELMSFDELELDTLGERKTALFIITSDTDKTFNFIAAIMYSQMFNLLCDKALEYGGRLPVHVRCILDEFANMGQIPNFENIISVIRSREISACPILQSKAQLEAVYDKKADIIIDNCDTMLFLGGKGKILEEVSKLLGRQTIDQNNDSHSRGAQRNDSTSFQKLGRELLMPDELATLSNNECICHIRGVRPFKSKKYNLTSHPRYPLTSDADAKNTFVPLWLRPPVTITPDETFRVLL